MPYYGRANLPDRHAYRKLQQSCESNHNQERLSPPHAAHSETVGRTMDGRIYVTAMVEQNPHTVRLAQFELAGHKILFEESEDSSQKIGDVFLI